MWIPCSFVRRGLARTEAVPLQIGAVQGDATAFGYAVAVLGIARKLVARAQNAAVPHNLLGAVSGG